MSEGFLDVDDILEDYTWRHFKDIQSMRKTRIEEYKNIEKDDVEFVFNRKKLSVAHGEPKYVQLYATNARPCTLFKSVYTNNTDRPQEYSFKTERTTESLCTVVREQGYMFGGETELTLKTPCEIAELKAGFKHEMFFNTINENTVCETITWGVDSNVVVPAHYITEAAIIIEEMNYQGTYSVTTKFSGLVTITMRRRKDNLLIVPLTINIVEVFREYLDSRNVPKHIKSIIIIDNNSLHITSKGKCQFQASFFVLFLFT